MAEGRYVRFEPKYDNSNEVISATHINVLQDTSERVQQGIFRAQDRDFLDKALFILEHHRILNGMWIDLFENTSRIQLNRSTHLVFSEVEQGIVFPDSSTSLEGWLYSVPYVNPNLSNMKKVMVITQAYIPEGTSIDVEISNNNADWYRVPLSNSDLFEIPTEGSKLMLRAKFQRATTDISPRLDAWAILFFDPKNNVIELPDGEEIIISPGEDVDPGEWGNTIKIFHHQLLGIGPNDHHPQEHSHDGTDGSGFVSHKHLIEVGPDDHHPKAHYHGEDGVPYIRLDTDVVGTLPYENLSYQVWTGKPGGTGLYFDPNQGDKLVYVKTPDDETYLFYDQQEDRLSHTIYIVQGIAVWEEFIFSEYINSNGETEIRFAGTDKKHYDASDEKIVTEIQKVMAPDKPVGLTAINLGDGVRIQLVWLPNKEIDLAGYNVYYSPNGTSWIRCNTNGLVGSPSFVVSGLTPDAEYHFAVTAVDSTGYESHRSVSIIARPMVVDTVAPDMVTNVTIERMAAGSHRLTWDPNQEPDLDSYRVYQSASGASGSFALVQTLDKTANEYVNFGLLIGSTYYYYVTAVDKAGNESMPSTIVSHIA